MSSHSSNGNKGRQFVKFSFFKLDTAFRKISDEAQKSAKLEFLAAIQNFNRRMLLRSYSLVGLRGDVDFMLWQVAPSPEPFQALMTALLSTSMGPYLSMPHSFLAITRRSIYDIGEMVEGDTSEERIVIQPGDHDYLFVYPFIKTRPWYALSQEERQEMINEHIRVGRNYPQIKLNTTYSYGIDDQEFVVAFEGDNPSEFVDLVMDLRFTEASMYTLRDTPMFTCRNLSLAETLDSLGGVSISSEAEALVPDRDGWIAALPLDDLTESEAKSIFLAGKQVAVFKIDGTIYALSDRCSHARGPLSEGKLDGSDCSVTCPWHYAKFDLTTGKVLDGVASTGVSAYEADTRNGMVYLRERQYKAENTTTGS